MKVEIMAEYGRRVEKLMKRKGWNQKTLEAATGIPQQEISRICTGKVKTANVEVAMTLAKALEVPPGWLLFGIEGIDEISSDGFRIAAAWDKSDATKKMEVALKLLTPEREPFIPDIRI